MPSESMGQRGGRPIGRALRFNEEGANLPQPSPTNSLLENNLELDHPETGVFGLLGLSLFAARNPEG